jgi:hypothetical protein
VAGLVGEFSGLASLATTLSRYSGSQTSGSKAMSSGWPYLRNIAAVSRTFLSAQSMLKWLSTWYSYLKRLRALPLFWALLVWECLCSTGRDAHRRYPTSRSRVSRAQSVVRSKPTCVRRHPVFLTADRSQFEVPQIYSFTSITTGATQVPPLR